MNDRTSSAPGAHPALTVPLTALLAGIVLSTGCGLETPANPTWTEDVRPILMSNCARCHTDPPIGEAPGYLRLDRYDNWDLDDGTTVVGAAAVAPNVAARVEAGTMPPANSDGPELTEEAKAQMIDWAQCGTPQ